jgi:hypothetical protein
LPGNIYISDGEINYIGKGVELSESAGSILYDFDNYYWESVGKGRHLPIKDVYWLMF